MRHHTTMNRKTSAFTMVEMALVIVIIAVIAAIAVPRFSNSIARQRVDSAARRIAADLGLARQHAMKTDTPILVIFDATNHGYVLKNVPHPDRPGTEYLVHLAKEPYLAQLKSVDFGGDQEVIFDIYGTPDQGGTISIALGPWQKTVKLDSETGLAEVE